MKADCTMPIVKGVTYPQKAFLRMAGISYARTRRAIKLGVNLADYTFTIGRLKYIKGEDGIRYLDALSKLTWPNWWPEVETAASNAE